MSEEVDPVNGKNDLGRKGLETLPDIIRTLSKVVDKDKIPNFLDGSAFIEESELEVKDLELNDDEFQLLVTRCSQYFTNDAMSSLHANYESCSKHEGYILPVYTETEEAYWLFHHPGRKSELLNLQPDTKIWGYWLDATPEKLKYELLVSKEKISIEVISIISTENEQHGHLSLKMHLDLKSKFFFSITQSFHDSIVACLEKHGFM